MLHLGAQFKGASTRPVWGLSQAALSVAYGAGLSAAEVTALKVRDIDSERMLLRVERGKTSGTATP